MARINQNYLQVKQSYLFSDIAHRLEQYKAENPDAPIIKMGIGDVTLPLCSAVTQAIKTAADEMGSKETFRGYGPEQGYAFLREEIAAYYARRGVAVKPTEIFVSDGAKSDLGNILDIFSKDNTVLISDPVYPVYSDTNVMDGRPIVYAAATAENGFLPLPQQQVDCDLIYLCSPNNPTGAVYSKEQLQLWVDYALQKDAVILFDAAYEAFIRDETLPHSIFEIPGAARCAIEFCSFSKTAGFTGVRCGYTVVPDALVRQGVTLNTFWLRRQTTKFNGVSYPVQRAAQAVFSQKGQQQVKENIDYYLANAKILTDAMDALGIFYTGGKNSPYVWLKCPGGMDSWEFFDFLLHKAHIVGTPGSGFGENGKQFFRLTAFSTKENTQKAVERLKEIL